MSRWRNAITRDEQLKLIENAKAVLMTAATGAAIPLHRVEFVVPFVPTDFGLSAWLFLESDAQLNGSDAERWKAWLKVEFIDALRQCGYPERWLREVCFVFDSHENVVKNFEGSYFYRLR